MHMCMSGIIQLTIITNTRKWLYSRDHGSTHCGLWSSVQWPGDQENSPNVVFNLRRCFGPAGHAAASITCIATSFSDGTSPCCLDQRCQVVKSTYSGARGRSRARGRVCARPICGADKDMRGHGTHACIQYAQVSMGMPMTLDGEEMCFGCGIASANMCHRAPMSCCTDASSRSRTAVPGPDILTPQ